MNKINVRWAGQLGVVFLALLSATGCGESRPDGMPELFPAKVTITQEGVPLAGATVTLYPEDSSLTRWPVGGTTGANGVATMMTSTNYTGAPAGKFKIIVSKTVTEGDPVPKHPGQGATREQIQEYDRALKTGKFEMFKVVAKEYRAAGTTPLSVEIAAAGENSFTEDLGAAVKEKDEQGSVTAGTDESYAPM